MEKLGDAAARLLRRLERGRNRPAEANSAEIGRGEVSGSFTDSHPAPVMPGETVGPIDRATVTPRQFGSRMVRIRPLPEVVYVTWVGQRVVAANGNHASARLLKMETNGSVIGRLTGSRGASNSTKASGEMSTSELRPVSDTHRLSSGL